jgi:hypothetical protein
MRSPRRWSHFTAPCRWSGHSKWDSTIAPNTELHARAGGLASAEGSACAGRSQDPLATLFGRVPMSRLCGLGGLAGRVYGRASAGPSKSIVPWTRPRASPEGPAEQPLRSTWRRRSWAQADERAGACLRTAASRSSGARPKFPLRFFPTPLLTRTAPSWALQKPDPLPLAEPPHPGTPLPGPVDVARPLAGRDQTLTRTLRGWRRLPERDTTRPRNERAARPHAGSADSRRQQHAPAGWFRPPLRVVRSHASPGDGTVAVVASRESSHTRRRIRRPPADRGLIGAGGQVRGDDAATAGAPAIRARPLAQASNTAPCPRTNGCVLARNATRRKS